MSLKFYYEVYWIIFQFNAAQGYGVVTPTAGGEGFDAFATTTDPNDFVRIYVASHLLSKLIFAFCKFRRTSYGFNNIL